MNTDFARHLRLAKEVVAVDEVSPTVDTGPELPYSLHILAYCYALAGDAVSAEGLWRSALMKLEKTTRTLEVIRVHDNASIAFADMLARMEWSGKSRAAEAESVLTAHREFAASSDVNLTACDASGSSRAVPFWLLGLYGMRWCAK